MFDAFRKVIAEEGILNCWNGATPTIARACALNIAMLTTYEEVKERLTKSFSTMSPFSIMVTASMFSAVATSCASLPFDNVKTKL